MVGKEISEATRGRPNQLSSENVKSVARDRGCKVREILLDLGREKI
jgi:hypothetical protein